MYRIRIEKIADGYWKEENFDKILTTERMITDEMLKNSKLGDEKEILTFIFGLMYNELKNYNNGRSI
jgi:hypothetical protein